MYERQQFLDLYNNAKLEKNSNTMRWGRICKIGGVASVAAIFYGIQQNNDNKQTTEYYNQDEGVFDPIISQSIITRSNFVYSLLFGNRKPSFYDFGEKKNKEDEAARKLSDCLFDHRSNFVASSRSFLETSDIPLGNGGFLFLWDDDDKIFNFFPLTCYNSAIMLGDNGQPNGVFMTRLLSELEFMTQFGVDAYSEYKRAEKLEAGYQENQRKEIALVYCVMKNPEYKKTASGKRGNPYICSQFVENQRCEFLDIKEFDYCPFVYHRNMVIDGETYGRGDVDRILSSAESVNDMTRDVMGAIDKMNGGPIGVMAELSANSKLDLTKNGVTFFNPMTGQNGSPTFPMLTNEDPSGAYQALIPRLDESISRALGLNHFQDISNAVMTARQITQNVLDRMKALLPAYMSYREQILLPMFKEIMGVLIRKTKWKFTEKVDFIKPIPNNYMEEAFNNNVMQKLVDVQNMILTMKNTTQFADAMFKIYPLLRDAIEGSKYYTYFATEDEYKEMVQSMLEMQAYQAQLGMNGSGGTPTKLPADQEDMENANASLGK